MPYKNANKIVIVNAKENKSGAKFWSKEEVGFSQYNVNEYKEMFIKLKADGVVLKGDFDSNVWYISNKKEDEKIGIFRFDIDEEPELETMLKGFLIVLFYLKRAEASGFDSTYNFIIKVAKITDIFKCERRDEFKNFINEEYLNKNNGKVTKGLHNYRKGLLKFLTFSNIQTKHEFINLVKEIIPGQNIKSVRDLPPFDDLIRFDIIVNDFFSLTDEKYKFLQDKFRPIEIWWKFSVVIPIRIGEFVRFKKNCLSPKKLDKYNIEIPRIKVNQEYSGEITNTEEYVIQTLEITKELYEMFENYISFQSDNDSEFIFNRKNQFKYLNEYEKLAVKKNTKNETDSITTGGFNSLLKAFYKTVVRGIYKVNFQRKKAFRIYDKEDGILFAVQPGDTRHIAIGSMVEMGVNPLIISYMANQNKIKSQESYSQYIVKEAEVKAKVLGTRLASKFKQVTENIKHTFDNTSFNNDYALSIFINKGGWKIREGICKNKYPVFNCNASKCFFCEDSIPIIDDSNRTYMKLKVMEEREKVLTELKILQEVIDVLLTEVTRDSIKLEDGHFTGNDKLVEDLGTQYIDTVMLKNRLVVIEAIDILIKEKEAVGVAL